MNRLPRAASALALALVPTACTSASSAPVPRDATSDAPSGSEAGDAFAEALPPPCGPADVSHFTPTWNPPVGPHAGACTDAQLAALMPACFAALATSASCSVWTNDPANAGCFACWSGPVTASPWAADVYADNPGETDYLNVSGCVALADPSELPCAMSLQAALECEFAACLTDCPIPGNSTSQGIQLANEALDDCYNAADDGGCKTLVDQSTGCATPLEDAGAAAFCFVASKELPALLQFFTLACGVGAADSGAAAD